MKKRILCYGDSNTWGFNAMNKKVYGQRFPEDVRWTGRLQIILGDEYTVIEEGLCGRTTVFDDPLRDGLNGLKYLIPCLAIHNPLDYMILMLGTNDCKARFAALLQNNDTIKPDTQDRIRFCEKRILNKDSSSRKQQNTTINGRFVRAFKFYLFFCTKSVCL